MKSGIFIDNFVMNQLKLGNFSTRGLHVTFSAIKASIIYPDHVAGKADGRSGNSDLVSLLFHIKLDQKISKSRKLLFTYMYKCNTGI